MQIKLEKNSVCSKWEDLVSLVASQDIDAVDKEGNGKTEEFLEVMEVHKKTASKERSGKKEFSKHGKFKKNK